MSLQINKSRAMGWTEAVTSPPKTFPKWGSVNPEAPRQAATEYRMKLVAEMNKAVEDHFGVKYGNMYNDTLLGKLMSELHDKLFSAPIDTSMMEWS